MLELLRTTNEDTELLIHGYFLQRAMMILEKHGSQAYGGHSILLESERHALYIETREKLES
jgi:hypothetical protein